MKINRKFLGIMLGLGLTFSLSFAASAKGGCKHGSIAYSVKGIDSKENKTDVNDMLSFYITIKKMLKQNGMLDEQMKTQILNKITSGDRKEQKLKLPVTMGGRGIKRDDENIGQAIEFCVENEKKFNDLQKAVEKTDFKKIEITEDDFKEAKEEVLKNHKERAHDIAKTVKECENKLELSDIDLLKKSIEEDKKELKSKKDAETKARYDKETVDAINSHIKEFEKYVKDLENKKEKSKELKIELEDLRKSCKEYVSRGKEEMKKFDSYLKDLSGLKFENVKESKNKFKFKNEITNIKDGDFYMN